MYGEFAKVLRFSFLVYYILSISFRVLFLKNYNVFLDSGASLFFDYVADLFYLVDLVFSSPRVNVVHPQTQQTIPTAQHQVSKSIHRQTLVVQNQGSAKIYARKQNNINITFVGSVTKFLPQFVMIFPFEVIGLMAGMDAFYILRSIRLVRCVFFYEYWTDVGDLLRKYKVAVSAGAQRVVLFTLLLAIVCHVAACLFYSIALGDLSRGISNNWLVRDGLATLSADRDSFTLHESVSFRYVRAIYWSVQTLTTVGFGDLTAWSQSETWFCIFYFLVIALLVSLTLANLTMAITSYDAAHTENLKKIHRFEKYAAYRRLPPALTNRVVSYYEHQWKRLRGMDELQIQGELPSRLRNQVIHHVIRDKLLVIEALRLLNKSCLNALTSRVESYVYSPQDVILAEGGVVTGVHIIAEGTVLRSREKIKGDPLELEEGELFGERGVMESYNSHHAYVAKEYSEILFLPGATFRHLCQLYLTSSEIDQLICSLTQLSLETSAARRSVKAPAFVKKFRPSLFGRRSTLVRSNTKAPKKRVKDSMLMELYKKCMAPNSTFRMWWGALIFCGIVFYTISSGLLLQAVLRQRFVNHYTPLLAVCYLVDGIFVTDSLLQALCFSYDDNGAIVTDYATIFSEYCSQPSSALNLLLVFPFDVIFGLSLDYRLIPPLRLLKVAHLLRFDESYLNIEDLLFTYVGVTVSFEMSRFVYLYMMLFFVCHWCGCLWTLVAEVAMKIFGYETSWRFVDSHDGFFALNYESLSGTTPYWRELYWTVNVMSSIGWPSTLPTNAVEYIGISVLMFVGYLLFTTLVGALSSLMGSFNSTGHAFNAKVDKIRQLVKYKSVSKPIEHKIVRYYEYIWARYGGIDEAEVLGNLPKSLRAAVANHVLGPLLNRVPFFDCCSEPMEQMIVSLFETRIFLEDDALMLCGEVGQDMFIIEKGEVEITSADRSTVYAKLKDGDYVGESCFLELSKRTASAYALDYVDTYFLTRDSFLKAAEKFPAEYNVVIDAIRETLRAKAAKNAALSASHRPRSLLEPESISGGDEEHSSGSGSSSNTRKQQLEGKQGKVSSNKPELETEAVANEGNIHPESGLKMLWDVTISITMLYYAIVIPMRIALDLKPNLLYLDYIFDAVNVYENYLNMAVFAVYAAGELLVIDPLIRAHYLKTRFLGDLIAGFPYDLIALAFLDYSPSQLTLIRAILRLPKLVRLRLAPAYFGQVKRLVQKTGMSSMLIVILELAFSVFLVMHWVACVFYMFAQFGGRPADCVVEAGAYFGTACRFRNTWVGQQIASLNLPQDGGSQWYRFLKAQYWALSTTVAVTIGDMVTMSNIEVVYCFFVTFFGLCVNGMILGSVMNLVHDASEESDKVYRTMEVMQAYLVANNVPPDLVTRAVVQMRHLATTEGALAVNQAAIFGELPHSIKLAIDNQVKTIPFLRRCPIFDFCNEEILRGISSKLQVQFNVKGDKIINGGELGQEMFFVESGSVQVMSVDGSVHYSTLEEGAFFGETAIFFRTVRSATVVVASPFCVCLRLSKTDLEHELRAADFDPLQVITAFKTLQASNERRNRAVTANLALAKDPKSKLFKLIKPEETGREHESWLYILRSTLSPSSHARMYWDFLGLLLLLYYSLSIVVYIAFFHGAKVELYLRFIAFDYLIDLYWVLDIVLKAYIFSFKADIMHDKVVTDGEAIWKHYRDGGYFYLDVVASMPFEFLALLPGSSAAVIFICRINHVLRVCQLFDYANLAEAHLQEKMGFALSRATWYLLRFCIVYMIVCHWLSCGYFMIHRYAELDQQRTYMTVDGMATWNPETGEHDICSHSLSYCYSRSLYFVVGTITGIGYGDIAPRTALETFYQMVNIVVDMFLIATLHGFCAIYLEEHDAKSSDAFNAKMQMLQNYIAHRKLSKTDGDAILAQYTHMWRKVKSTKAERNEVLGMLSQSTVMDLSVHLQAGILKVVPLLQDVAYHTRRRIATALLAQIAMADTYLYKAGDSGECIFFVSHGSMRVELNADISMLDTRGLSALQILLHKHTVYSDVHVAGDHFGEFCVVSHAGLRPESVKVLSGSEVFSLSRGDLWAIFQYITYVERRQFIYELMTRVGHRHHIAKKMDTRNIDTRSVELLDDTRMKALYRMAFGVMNEIIGELNSPELLRSGDQDDDSNLNLKRVLRAHSASGDHFSQRDLIDLFERDSAANPNVRLTFSETALRSRVSSFNSSIDGSEEFQQDGSPRTRNASFALTTGASNIPASHAASISHLMVTKVPNLNLASPRTHSSFVMSEADKKKEAKKEAEAEAAKEDDLALRDIESQNNSEDDDEEEEEVAREKQDGFGGVHNGETRHRSQSNSFVHQRVRALSSGDLDGQIEMRSASPTGSRTPERVRKTSGVRFDPALREKKEAFTAVATEDAAVPVDALADNGGSPVVRTKSLALRRRSVVGDYNVVKNALEIEQIVSRRRFSLSIQEPLPSEAEELHANSYQQQHQQQRQGAFAFSPLGV